MEFIELTHENLAKEHICCAISGEKDVQVLSKKAWLEQRLDEGLVFLKGNVRGKCFIEYIPAEYAWSPVVAEGYMFIDCLWVSGQFKGHGYSTLLMDRCIEDSRSKGKKGLVILSSVKKAGFLSDPKYMRHIGFLPADSAPPYFELLYLPFSADSETPRFRPQVKTAPQTGDGFSVFFTRQCPFTAKYVPLLAAQAQERGAKMQVTELSTCEMAQNAPCPYTAFSLYYNGQFITHEIPSEKKLAAILTDKGF